jgi:hypothetical protein
MGRSTDFLHFLFIWTQLYVQLSEANLFTGALSAIGDTGHNVLGPVSFVIDSIPDPNDTGGTIVAIGANAKEDLQTQAVSRVSNNPAVC